MTDEQDPLAPLMRAVIEYTKAIVGLSRIYKQKQWEEAETNVRRVAALYGAWQRLTLGRTPAARIALEAARRAYEESA